MGFRFTYPSAVAKIRLRRRGFNETGIDIYIYIYATIVTTAAIKPNRCNNNVLENIELCQSFQPLL